MSAPPPLLEHLEVRLIGVPRLRWRGREVRPPTRKGLALLAYTVARGGAADRAELAELLWGAGGRRNVRQELHRLRALPGADTWLAAGERVEVQARSDLAAFEWALAEGEAGRAVALHDGRPLLDGLSPRDASAFEAWLEEERARLQQRFADALRAFAVQQEQEGDPAEARRVAERLRALDPLDESATRLAMRLALRRGDLEGAWHVYETCRRTLQEELGIEPTDRTRRLARLAAQGRRDLRVRARRARAQLRMPRELLRPPVLAGREAAWRALADAAASGRFAVLTGPAGVGKTRLMMDFAQARGRVLVAAGHPGDDAVPLASFARAVRHWVGALPELRDAVPPWVRHEAARLAPELAERAPEPVRTREERARFTGAMAELVVRVAARVDVIAFDDLHAFDDASLELAFHAAAELTAAREPGPSPEVRPVTPRAAILAGVRAEEGSALLTRTLRRQETAGTVQRVALASLDPAGVATLLDGLGYQGEALAEALHRYAGGTPQVLIEVLKDLHERGLVLAEPDGGWALDGDAGTLVGQARPERGASMIGWRLERLPAGERTLLEVLAVMGVAAEPGLLARVAGRAVAAVSRDLAALHERQFLREGDLAHELLREAVLARLPADARRDHHRAVARALDAHGATPARVAHHAWQAGETSWALRRWLTAADRAAAQGASDQAGTWLTRIAEAEEAPASLRARAYLRLGRLRMDWDVRAASEAVRHGLSLARACHDAALEAWCLVSAADAATFAGDAGDAAAKLQQARTLAEEVLPAAERDELMLHASVVSWHLGDFAGSEPGIRAALTRDPRARGPRVSLAMLRWHQGRFREAAGRLAALLRDDPEAAEVTLLYHDLGVSQWMLGRFDRAAWYLTRSREVWQGSGNRYAEAMTAMAWGALETSRGRDDEASRQLHHARELFVAQGNRVRSADVDVRLAHLHHLAGRDEEVRTLCDRASAHLADAGSPYLASYLYALSAANRARTGAEALARDEVATALDQAGRAGHPLASVLAGRAAAEVGLEVGDMDLAAAHAGRVTSLARRTEMPEHLGHGLLLEARVHRDTDPARASRLARGARTLARRYGLPHLARALDAHLPQEAPRAARPERLPSEERRPG